MRRVTSIKKQRRSQILSIIHVPHGFQRHFTVILSNYAQASISTNLFDQDRLFNISSSYRLLYPESCTFNEGDKLISMMYKICELAARENAMESFLSDVARSHFEHGVLVHEFGEFCGCILWTFSKCLGAEFGSHSRLAWEKLASRVLRSLLPNMYALSLKARGERGHNPSEVRRDRQHTVETSRSAFGEEDDGY